MHQCLEFARNAGSIITVGVPKPDSAWDIPMPSFLVTGKKVMGTIEGDVNPREFVPQMIQWYRDGKLPIEKLVRMYQVNDFEQALHDMHSGETIKAVLLW